VEIAVTHAWSGVLPIHRDIVIVENDKAVRELMVEILDGIRADIATFASTSEALNHMLDSYGNCSLLITDHGPPGNLSGLALAAMFQAKWPRIPVILTCGCGLATDILPDGIVYLQKPWPIDVLISAVRRLLTQ
jgi:FixJ family two-component response regulator